MIAVSVGARLLAAFSFTVPWIAPDEMVYGLLGQDLWQNGTLTIRDSAVPYLSILYPAFVGLPLLADDLADGVRTAQALQSLVVSLTAIPVYLWGRRFLDRRWALAAAALTLVTPALTYAGLLMTETLARMLETPTLVRQGVSLLAVTIVAAIRLQAVLLLPVLVVAALLYALFVRSPAILARLAPLLVILGLGSLLAIGWIFWSDSAGLDDVVGAYAAGSRPESTALGLEIVWHAGFLVILGAFVPAIAVGTLVWRAARVGEPELPSAAFLATAAAFVPLLALQVAAFAAGNVDHVGGRYLVGALPVLALGLCLWAARGAPWERIGTPVLAAIAVASVALTPVDEVAAVNGAHDLFETLVFRHIANATSDAVAQAALVVAVALAVGAVVAVSRFRVWTPPGPAALVVAVGCSLAAASALAARDVARLSARAEKQAFGEEPASWVDQAGAGPAVLLATGDLLWTSNARILFWNESVRRIVGLPGAEWHGPLPVVAARLDDDGRFVDAEGRDVTASSVVAPAWLEFSGQAVADTPLTADEPAKTVWRTDGRLLRATIAREGFTPVGDFLGEARVTVFGCTRGALRLTLLGKQGEPINIGVNGIPVKTLHIAPETVWRGSIAAPPNADGTFACEYVLESPGLVGSTQVTWVPEGA
jgi:PAS domain-containing protein